MKKTIIISILLLSLTTGLFAQSIVTTTLTGKEGSTIGLDFDGNFKFNLNGSFGMTFKSNWGFDAKVDYNLSSKKFGIRPAAIYRVPLDSKKGLSFLFLLGPTFDITSDKCIFGIDLMAYLDIQLGKHFFTRLGTGAQMRFEKNNFQGYVPLPEVAIGATF